jgi:hypothetical protein
MNSAQWNIYRANSPRLKASCHFTGRSPGERAQTRVGGSETPGAELVQAIHKRRLSQAFYGAAKPFCNSFDRIAIQGYQRSGTAMLLKFRLEMDVMIDQDAETALIELARQHYESEGGVTVPGRRGRPTRVPAEKFIEGTDQALLELLEHQSLLREAGIEVERMSCRPIESLPETARTGVELSNASGRPELSAEVGAETKEAEDLDDLESGLYLCRWPNGDFSVVKADSRREAIIQLDEWAGAEPAWLAPMDECMIDFRLNDHAEIELLEFGEETTDFIWERCYPALRAVLPDDAVGPGVGEDKASVAGIIRTAVEHERKRLWTAPRDGTPARTELGRKLEKRLGTVGVVADHYVENAANEILRGKAGEKGKPN